MFHYVGAGFTPTNVKNLKLYVRYEKNPNRIDFDYHEDKGYTIVKCPDRTLLLFRPNCTHVPTECIWDEFLIFDPFKLHSAGEGHIDWLLMSAHNAMLEKEGKDPDYFDSPIQITLDSGGAQLKIGSTPYINPKKIIQFYNKMKLPTPVYGMSLDVPPRPVDQAYPEIIKLCAVAQKRNNDIFKDLNEGHVKLMNAIHGWDLTQARIWMDTVRDEDFIGWAAGSDDIQSDFNNFQTLLVPMIEDDKNKIFHMFGQSGNTRITLLAWFGKYVKFLTADSSTAIQEGMRRKFYVLTPDTFRIQKIRLGRKIHENPHAILPCHCPLCQRFKYKDIFDLPTKTRVIRYLFWHNLWTTIAYSNIWVWFAENFNKKEYKKQLKLSFGSKKGMKSNATYDFLSVAIDFVSYAFENGLDKTQTAFKDVLSKDPVRSGIMPRLFEDEHDTSERDAASFSLLGKKDSAAIDILPYYLPEDELINLLPQNKDLMYRKCHGCGETRYRGTFRRTKVGKKNLLRCNICRKRGKKKKLPLLVGKDG